MAQTLKWQHIEDLPHDWVSLASPELASLTPIWREQSDKLRGTGALQEFTERLHRRWAIETGVIEGLYTLDRGITQLLIEHGIEAALVPHGATDRPPEEVVRILQDQKEVVDGLFDFVKGERSLSESYIKELHAALTRNQRDVEAVDAANRLVKVPLERGKYKTRPNNPTRGNGTVHEYCPPEHVASEMEQLVAWHSAHTERKIPPEIEAAWLHHRFAQIHPFQDGNGRVARTLASLVFLRPGLFPLVITRDDREPYIRALEDADAGNLKPLVDLFVKGQKAEFLDALQLAADVTQVFIPEDQIIQAAVERLRAKYENRRKEQEQVFDTSARLQVIAYNRLSQMRDKLFNAFSEIKSTEPRSTYTFNCQRNAQDNAQWYRGDIIGTARELRYYADTESHRAWVRLQIRETRHPEGEARYTELVISFHSVGPQFVGVLGASAFVVFRDIAEDGSRTHEGPHRVCKELFQFTFNDDTAVAEARFRIWLDEVLPTAIDQWRRQL